jgi:cytochrome c553
MMKLVVKNLTNEDMLDIAAYLTSLSVEPPSAEAAGK